MIENFYQHLCALAQNRPNDIALLSCNKSGSPVETLSYKKLLEQVISVASYFHIVGITSGDRIALDLENCTEHLIVSWAAWSCGIITVPLDSKRDTEELRAYKISISRVKTIITNDSLEKILNTPFIDCLSFEEGLEKEALILFTSGTTALPKGAELTLRNLLTNAEGLSHWLHVSNSDRLLIELPLHHINSTIFCLSALTGGASIAIPPGYSNSLFWQQVAQTGATYTSLVQSIIFDQLTRVQEFQRVRKDVRLSRIQIGSAPVVPASIFEFMAKYNIPLFQGYGQTETALRVTGVPMGLPEKLYTYLIEENSIGEPMSWADVKITDDAGNFLPPEQEGEIVVKGGAVMQGYIAGESAFRNGYFLTGDIGFYKVIEGRCFFFLKGRKKEILIKGGVNISPTSVENNLKKISDEIEQAYVVGVPEKRYGEEVGAVIVFKKGVPTAAALRRLKMRLLRGSKHLRNYETPVYIRITDTEFLPKTSTGKVQRIVLKQTPIQDYETIYEIFKTATHRFLFLNPQSPYIEAAHALYNHCWQPLTIELSQFREKLKGSSTIVAVDSQNKIDGQISFNWGEGILTCTSICSATYRPKPIPFVQAVPTPKEVEDYILSGNDGIYNFHAKLGAHLCEVIQNGRPEDKSSLGYTMLLEYPPTDLTTIPAERPVSAQLIAATRILAHDFGLRIQAHSRPGGLAHYLHRKNGVDSSPH